MNSQENPYGYNAASEQSNRFGNTFNSGNDRFNNAGTPPPPPGGMHQRPYKPDNYLILSILCTLFCCLPLGIVSIVYSSKVDNLYYNQDYAGAERASRQARNWCIASVVVNVVAVALYFILFFVGFWSTIALSI